MVGIHLTQKTEMEIARFSYTESSGTKADPFATCRAAAERLMGKLTRMPAGCSYPLGTGKADVPRGAL